MSEATSHQGTKITRTSRCCTLCREPGHTIRTCLRRNPADFKQKRRALIKLLVESRDYTRPRRRRRLRSAADEELQTIAELEAREMEESGESEMDEGALPLV